MLSLKIFKDSIGSEKDIFCKTLSRSIYTSFMIRGSKKKKKKTDPIQVICEFSRTELPGLLKIHFAKPHCQL